MQISTIAKVTITLFEFYNSVFVFHVLLADHTIGRAFGTICRLSSVTFCIVAKRYVLAKKCLKKLIGNHGQKVDFLHRRHISTSVSPLRPPRQPLFALFIVAKRYVLAKKCLKE